MRKNNLRLITEEELKKVNAVISPRFGNNNRIVSGSFQSYDGKEQCNIALFNSNYNSHAMLVEIGKHAKRVFDVDEVYGSGIRLA